MVLNKAPPSRLTDLYLDSPALIAGTDLSFSLCNIAVDYTPSGRVLAPGIFHAELSSTAARLRGQ